MGTPYLAEIRLFSFNFPPRGWALCNGQTISIAQNEALFALLGTTYGGDGRTTFKLPNLEGRVAMHQGPNFIEGQAGGEQSHTLVTSELPPHTHGITTTTAPATVEAATGNLPATTAASPYSLNSNTTAGGTTLTGGNQPHENMAPYLVMTYCIALQGIFPSQD